MGQGNGEGRRPAPACMCRKGFVPPDEPPFFSVVLGTCAHPPPAQLNIANPSTGCMKVIEVDDEKQLYVNWEGVAYSKGRACPPVGVVFGLAPAS